MRNIILLSITLALFNCNSTPQNVEENYTTNAENNKKAQEQKYSSFEQLTDSVLKQIMSSRIKWFNSWKWSKDALKIKDFKLDLQKILDLNWIAYNPNDAYIKHYDSLLIYSDSNLAIDLYSYNTLIELQGTDVLVEFDVDSKIYIVNKSKSIRTEILTSGSYEFIEDALWLNKKTVVLLGYIKENQKKNSPFLWFLDIETKKLFGYRFTKSFSDIRNNYFFVKHPNTKLRVE